MEPVTIGIGIAVILTSTLAALVTRYRRRIREQDQNMQAVVEYLQTCKQEAEKTRRQYEIAYEHEACDEKLIVPCRDLLKSLCPNGIEQRFNQLHTLDARKRFLTDLTVRAAQIMQIAPVSVSFAEMQPQTYGGYDLTEERICLNELYVIEQPVRIVESIFHELKHVVQRRSLSDKRWGYSARLRGLWKICFEQYSCGIFYEAYATQAIEIDARHFAEEIVHKFNEKHEIQRSCQPVFG